MKNNFHDLDSQRTPSIIKGTINPSHSIAAAITKESEDLNGNCNKTNFKTYAVINEVKIISIYVEAGMPFFLPSFICLGVIPINFIQGLPNNGPYHRNPNAIVTTAATIISQYIKVIGKKSI